MGNAWGDAGSFARPMPRDAGSLCPLARVIRPKTDNRGISTARGCTWHATTVRRLLARDASETDPTPPASTAGLARARAGSHPITRAALAEGSVGQPVGQVRV